MVFFSIQHYCSLLLLVGLLCACENKPTADNNNNQSPEPDSPKNEIVAPTVEPRQVLESFDFFQCKALGDEGCSCAYSIKGADTKAPVYFASGMGINACVKVGGELQTVTSRDLVYREKLRAKVDYANNHEDWIVLKEQGPMLFFGSPVPPDQEPKEYLVHILLMMDNIPADVPIVNETPSMAIKEVREMAAEAVKIAKERQEKAQFSFFEEDLYYNEHYQVIVDTKQMTQYEGEANTYEGDIILKDKAGNMLHIQPVSGTCGC